MFVQMFLELRAAVTELLCVQGENSAENILSRRPTIDKVGQLFGRGLVSKDNRPMKSLNTRHSSRQDSDVKNGRR